MVNLGLLFKHILYYHIWAMAILIKWPKNNIIFTVLSTEYSIWNFSSNIEKDALICIRQSNMSGLGWKKNEYFKIFPI